MPVTTDRGYPSSPEVCQLAARDVIRTLKLPDVTEAQIERGDDWQIEGKVFEGITCHDGGEQYASGVVGMEEVAYRVAVTMVARKTRDAKLVNDPLPLWRMVIRSRFMNQRIPVGNFDAGVLRLICVVRPGRPAVPRGKPFDDYSVDQLIILFWVREIPDRGE